LLQLHKSTQSTCTTNTTVAKHQNIVGILQAVVLEGKYWKRRIETVVAEYKKWRAFYVTKVCFEITIWYFFDLNV